MAWAAGGRSDQGLGAWALGKGPTWHADMGALPLRQRDARRAFLSTTYPSYPAFYRAAGRYERTSTTITRSDAPQMDSFFSRTAGSLWVTACIPRAFRSLWRRLGYTLPPRRPLHNATLTSAFAPWRARPVSCPYCFCAGASASSCRRLMAL